MFVFTLSGVEIKRRFVPRRRIRGALTALDLKITEYQERSSDRRWSNSVEALAECREILGELKFMYLSDLLRPGEYRRVVYALTGYDFEEREDMV